VCEARWLGSLSLGDYQVVSLIEKLHFLVEPSTLMRLDICRWGRTPLLRDLNRAA